MDEFERPCAFLVLLVLGLDPTLFGTEGFNTVLCHLFGTQRIVFTPLSLLSKIICLLLNSIILLMNILVINEI